MQYVVQEDEIHLATWQHPRSREWCCIDYIVMKQRDRRCCVDVEVKRGAECNTDHQLLCAKVRMKGSFPRPRRRSDDHRLRYVTKLRNACGEEEQESGQSVRTEFVSGVLERARDEWPEEQSAEEKWRVMKAAMVDTAGEILGKVKKRQPNWFQDSEDHLRSYLMARNSAYRKWLASADRKYLIWFREARGKARREVRRAKEEWLKRKAQEAERERIGGKRVWDNIRDLQRAKRGRIPERVVTIQDEDGRPCDTNTEQNER